MLRAVLAVIVGFLMMAAIVGVTIAGITLLAPGFVFDGETGQPTPGYLVYGLATGLVAALAGGFMASFIAERPVRKPLLALAALVVVMGAAELILSRAVTVEGTTTAVTPAWYQVAIMIVGVGGVLGAARLSGRWAR